MPQRSSHQLVEFLTAVSGHQARRRRDRGGRRAGGRAVRRRGRAPWSSATRSRPRSASGLRRRLGRARAARHGDEVLDLPGLGRCHRGERRAGTATGPGACSSRAADAPFRRRRAQSAARAWRACSGSRCAASRPWRPSAAGRRARAPGARAPRPAGLLRERHRLLEVLLDIQRSISHRKPLSEVLAAVTAGRQRPARRLPGRARARRSARPRAPDRGRRPRPAASGRRSELAIVATAAARASSTPSADGGPGGLGPHQRRPRRRARRDGAVGRRLRRRPARHARRLRRAREPRARPTRAPSRRWRRPSTTPSPGCPTARSSSTACSTRSTWRPAARPSCACSSSTSTASRPSTTASATPPATSCCAPSPTRLSRVHARGGHRGALRRRRVRRAARGRRARRAARRRSPTASSPPCAGPSTSRARRSSSAPRSASPTPATRSLGPDELLRNADLAMYRAKKAGGNRAATYETAMRTALLARIELEADLRHALERDELSPRLPARGRARERPARSASRRSRAGRTRPAA